mgnify:FL=1
MALVSRLIGEESGEYERMAEEVKEKTHQFFWNEKKGCFIDSRARNLIIKAGRPQLMGVRLLL